MSQRTTMPTRGITNRQARYVERLLSRFEVTESGCWHWLGTLTWGGYGQIARLGTNVTAHRAMWEHANGPIPDGMTLGHRCHDDHPDCAPGPCEHRACVNPKHTYLQTYAEQNATRHAREQRLAS
jgi:hypothetical protein